MARASLDGGRGQVLEGGLGQASAMGSLTAALAAEASPAPPLEAASAVGAGCLSRSGVLGRQVVGVGVHERGFLPARSRLRRSLQESLPVSMM